MAVLNFAEKNRMNKLISGFKDEITDIILAKDLVSSNYVHLTASVYGGVMPLDLIKKNTWYSGMELNKKYTLEELGL